MIKLENPSSITSLKPVPNSIPTNTHRVSGNYAWDLGAILTAGADLWLNTPRRPYEASGTSGMKAAMNGVPASVLSTAGGLKAASKAPPAGPSWSPKTKR